jgi:hypothetical protein
VNSFFNKIKEEISSIWTLLDDTSIFLSKINKFEDYEKDIRYWKECLRNYHHNSDIRNEIKREIINLRKNLRLDGYNLQLGAKDIEVFEFKSDDASLEGYKRMVLVIDKDDFFYLTGEENHMLLLKYLCIRLRKKEGYAFKGIHFLWYRWIDNILQFCGADSESKYNYENFKEFVKNNKNNILKKIEKK